MTEYEAIELLFQNAYDKEFTSESIEAFGMAIQALKKNSTVPSHRNSTRI